MLKEWEADGRRKGVSLRPDPKVVSLRLHGWVGEHRRLKMMKESIVLSVLFPKSL